MLEQIIIVSLFISAVLHIMQKWQIKNPLECDFCLAFWVSLLYFLVTDFTHIFLALPTAALTFYITIRINMYANNR